MTLRSLPSAAHPAQQSRPPERWPAQHVGREPPASDLPAAPPGAASKEDTPVYWQTLLVMVTAPWRRDA